MKDIINIINKYMIQCVTCHLMFTYNDVEFCDRCKKYNSVNVQYYCKKCIKVNNIRFIYDDDWWCSLCNKCAHNMYMNFCIND